MEKNFIITQEELTMKYGFGIDLGGTTVKIAYFDETGEMLEKWEIPTDTSENGIRILPDIAASVRAFLTERKIADSDILGLGIGVPGPVNAKGVVNRCINLGWDVFNIAQKLTELTGFPVKAGNDANVAALGEFWKGGGQGCDNMVFVTLGTGVGGGIVVEGKLLHGAHGSGAEIAPEADAGDGVTRYALPLPRYSVSITAPSDVTVTLCGAVLTLDDAESSDRGILRGLENYTGNQAFDTVRWSFDGLYSLPDVQATAADGTALSPLVGKNGQLMFFHPNNASLQSAVEDRVRYFFNRYIDYSSRSFQGNLALTREDVENDEIEMNPATRASMRRYYSLLDCIMWTTDLYRYIQESTDAMIWASATSVSYDELTFTDFSFVGANCFVCTVRYKADFTANSWQEQKNYNMQNAYELAFVCPNGGAWYAAAMDAVTE